MTWMTFNLSVRVVVNKFICEVLMILSGSSTGQGAQAGNPRTFSTLICFYSMTYWKRTTQVYLKQDFWKHLSRYHQQKAVYILIVTAINANAQYAIYNRLVLWMVPPLARLLMNGITVSIHQESWSIRQCLNVHVVPQFNVLFILMETKSYTDTVKCPGNANWIV